MPGFKKKRILFGALILAVVLFVPFPTRVARKCIIEIRDESGKPVANHEVTWSGSSYLLDSKSPLEEKVTDGTGTVIFESKTRWLSLINRSLSPFVIILNVHGNVHIHDGYAISLPEGFLADFEGDIFPGSVLKWQNVSAPV